MINIKINKKPIQVDDNITILEACNQIGIEIPNFCHDERLKPHSSCGICVVEVNGENVKNSCSTIVEEGMDIITGSEKVMKIRSKILEKMISNHDLSCKDCYKESSCKLQKYFIEYAPYIDKKNLKIEKKYLPINKENKFYDYDPNKCIKCKKCFRVCEELQNSHAIKDKFRTYKKEGREQIIAKVGDSHCVSCGNCIAVCPTGALTPKFEKEKASETKDVRTTCTYCGVGCQLDLKVKDDKVVGVEAANGPSNEGLLCVKGRFAYNFVNHKDRLTNPLIKKNGKFEEVSWEEAYDYIVENYESIKEEYGSDAFAGLASARCTNEDNYLFQKMFRKVIKTNNIDHCARL